MVSMTVDLDGTLHYLDYGGSGPPLVCIHGLGGSAINWLAVGSALARNHHVLAPDLPGFGHSPLEGRSAGLGANQELLDRFLQEVAGTPAVLVGNSMGAMLALLQSLRRPETVRALALVNPAVPWSGRHHFDLRVWDFFGSLTTPRAAGQRATWRTRRTDAARLVDEALAVVCARPDRVTPDLVEAHIEQVMDRRHSNGHHDPVLVQAGRSLIRALARRGQEELYGGVRAPVLVVHGERDRLVPLESSLTLAQRYGWLVMVLPGVGHVPMLEAPGEFLKALEPWLDTV
ncbi:MAG: alpha/beta hydrolase [Candidatus Dormibacteraeota bacterium]|nr:alpha/beta hydrolase [Candidatus Dormibacteraeota bacterium]